MPLPTLPPVPEWSNDKIIKFLELYEIERVIWDPCDKNHKLKHKVNDAWNRISSSLDYTPIEELKSKKKSLMATFRPLLKKKKASIRSGVDTEDVFQPIWFAFEIMERFLGTMYDVEETINTEHKEINSEDSPTESQQVVEILFPSPSQPVTCLPEPVSSPQPVYTRSIKAKKKVNTKETDTKITQTVETLSEVLKDNKRNNDKANDEDDCDIYAKLLAKRLRKYQDDYIRARIMHQIDGFLLQNPPDRLSNACSHNSSSSSLSQSQNIDPLILQKTWEKL